MKRKPLNSLRYTAMLAALALASAPSAKAGIIEDGIDLVTGLTTELGAGALAILGITIIFIGLRLVKKLMNRAG